MFPRVSIIILNWNGWKDTIECLESIFHIDYLNYDVIVVDNGSTDDSVQKIKEYCTGKIKVYNNNIKFFEISEEVVEKILRKRTLYEKSDINKRLILIKNRNNYGFTGGNNIGIRLALMLGADYILLLNNDCIVKDKDLLKKLIKVAEKSEKIGIVGPRVVSVNGEIQRSCARRFPTFLDFIFVYSFIGERIFKENIFWRKHFYYEYDFSYPKEVDIISGSCMLIKRKIFEKIGLLDENTFLYWEEPILGAKLKSLALKTIIEPSAEILHKGGETVRNLNLKSWARYHNRISELYFIENYTNLNSFKKRIIILILMLEALLALIFSLKSKNYDKYWELKLIKFLLSKIF